MAARDLLGALLVGVLVFVASRFAFGEVPEDAPVRQVAQNVKQVSEAERMRAELEQRRESPETFGEPGESALVSESGAVTTTAGLPEPGGEPDLPEEEPESVLVSSTGAVTTTAGLPEPGGEPDFSQESDVQRSIEEAEPEPVETTVGERQPGGFSIL